MNIVVLPHIPQLSEPSLLQLQAKTVSSTPQPLSSQTLSSSTCSHAFSAPGLSPARFPPSKQIVECQAAHFPWGSPPPMGPESWWIMPSLSVLRWGDSTWFLGGSPGLSVLTAVTSSLMHKLPAFSAPFLTSHQLKSPSRDHWSNKVFVSGCLWGRNPNWFRRTYLDHIQS